MDALEVAGSEGGNTHLWERLTDASSLAIWLGDPGSTTSGSFRKTEDVDV